MMHQHFTTDRHPLAHSLLYNTILFVTEHLQQTMSLTSWTRFFHGSRKVSFHIVAEHIASTIARSHGSDADAESHAARVRAAGGATGGVDRFDSRSNCRCSSCNSSVRNVSSRLNSDKVHPKPLGSRGKSQQQQLNMGGFDNNETLLGGEDQWQRRPCRE